MTRQLVKNLRRGGQSQPNGRLVMVAADVLEVALNENYKLRCRLQIAEGRSVENTELDGAILSDSSG